MAHECGKVVSPTQWLPLRPTITPGSHFCWGWAYPRGHSVARRIKSII